MADRRLHRGAIHCRAVSVTSAAHVHGGASENDHRGAGDSRSSQPFVLLRHRRGGEEPGRLRILRSEDRIPGNHADHQYHRQHSQPDRATRAHHRDEHHDHEEPLEIRQAIQAGIRLHRELPRQGEVRHQSQSNRGESSW